MTIRRSASHARWAGRGAAVAITAVSALVASGCGSDSDSADAEPRSAAVSNPIVTTYDGGVHVLDGATLKVVKDLPQDGFLRVNAAGDDRHVLVSTTSGFRVLDAVDARFTDAEFPASKPGHVVRHDDRTVLFADGTGDVTSFDPEQLGDELPPTTVHKSEHPHHGVAVELADGTLVTTLGTEESRPGIVAFDKSGKEIARNEDCAGVHGEATAQGDAVVVGCETGALIFKDGRITKVTSPTAYGRIGNQAGSDASTITLGDYKQDKDAELERPQQISLIDTDNSTLRLVDVGTSYTFRSLGRGPSGEALVLGTDGKLHSIDPASGQVTRSVQVVDAWQEPIEWQDPRPALKVRGSTAYVTDPATKSLRTVDLGSFTVGQTVTLPGTPNEIATA